MKIRNQLSSFSIIIVFLLIPFGVSGTFYDSVPAGIDQNETLVASYNTTQLTLFRNETKVLAANVTLDGSPLVGAYFELSEINYDLGETVTDLQNGSYLIGFIPASNNVVASDNYTISIIVRYDDLSISTPFEFNLLSHDEIDPELTVFSPVSGENYVDYMFLNLTGSDNIGWQEIYVNYRGQRVFTLFSLEDEQGRGTWNETHVQLSTYIFFQPISGNNEIEITLVDNSYNRVTEIRNSVGDGLPPNIRLISPLEGSIQINKEITVEWEADDNVAIEGFEIRVNNFPMGEYDADTRSDVIRLPVPEDERTDISLVITATDNSGNVNSSRISFTYDKDAYVTGNPEIEQRNRLITLGLWSLVGVFTILAGFVTRAILKSFRSDKQGKTLQRSTINNFPADQLKIALDYAQVNQDQYQSASNFIDQFSSDIKKLDSSSDVIQAKEAMINTFNEDFLQKFDIDDAKREELNRLIRTMIEDWISQIN